MTDVVDPVDTVHRLLAGVAEKRWDDLPALYAEDTVVTHPMDPTARTLRGRADLAEHFRTIGRAATGGTEFRAEELVIHRTEDPEVLVVEFAYVGTARHGAVALRVPNVFVMRIRDGEIVESRDYADHAAFARARESAQLASARPT